MVGFVPDRSSWNVLIRRVRAATRDRDAEDLLNAAFVKLEDYRKRVSVENPAEFLVRVAINLSRDERRRASARNHFDATGSEGMALPDEHPLQDEVFDARGRLRRVTGALDLLSPRTRQIFLMHRVEGLKYREIAERLGITISAVEKHIAKAALFLEEQMKGEQGAQSNP